MSTMFSLNVNKVALLRNSRGTNFPRVEDFVKRAIDMGVKGITVHPRPDERHIRYTDLYRLKQILNQYDGVEFNIEGFPSERFIEEVNEIQPDQITLVPDTEDQLTSDHGWDLSTHRDLLSNVSKLMEPANSRICVFWDPSIGDMHMLRQMGIDGIELYTKPYVDAFVRDDLSILEQYGEVFDAARDMQLRVNAGHDLNLENLTRFLHRCPVDEVSIGHAFFVEALYEGMQSVLEQYHKICY